MSQGRFTASENTKQQTSSAVDQPDALQYVILWKFKKEVRLKVVFKQCEYHSSRQKPPRGYKPH